jgi:hypothetical protein
MDAGIRELIRESRDTDIREVAAKRRLCYTLGLDAAAIAGEGFVVYSPGRGEMLAELIRSLEHPDSPAHPENWRLISHQAATVDALAALGAVSAHGNTAHAVPFDYLGFKPANG